MIFKIPGKYKVKSTVTTIITTISSNQRPTSNVQRPVRVVKFKLTTVEILS